MIVNRRLSDIRVVVIIVDCYIFMSLSPFAAGVVMFSPREQLH